jgi:hypothetical protein
MWIYESQKEGIGNKQFYLPQAILCRIYIVSPTGSRVSGGGFLSGIIRQHKIKNLRWP